MNKLVLLRHGESEWNRDNKFTGWTDVDLSQKGLIEAGNAGDILKKEGYCFDIAFTSLLKRAIRTLWIVLDRMDLMWIPVHRSWRLNERHYGSLQGLNKKETALKYGEERVHLWRRSYDVPPPPLERSDPRCPHNDPRYKVLTEKELPLSECLKDTIDRFMPCWHDVILKEVLSGKRVLISAHGNSLRALVKHLDGISESDIPSLEIPTGIPLVYELDDSGNSLRHYYLGDPDKIEESFQRSKDQTRSEK